MQGGEAGVGANGTAASTAVATTGAGGTGGGVNRGGSPLQQGREEAQEGMGQCHLAATSAWQLGDGRDELHCFWQRPFYHGSQDFNTDMRKRER